MNKETWKEIKGYEGIYLVNENGLVKSLDKKVKSGEKYLNRKGKVLKERIGKYGYPYVVLSHESNRKTFKVHRLVAEAFIPNPENKPCVNHINGIKTDNRIENLEWCTHKENTKHALINGLRKGVKGEKSHLSKLNTIQVQEIRDLYFKSNKTQLYISNLYNVSQSQIQRICSYKNWNHEK